MPRPVHRCSRAGGALFAMTLVAWHNAAGVALRRRQTMIDEVEEYLRQRRSMVMATQVDGEVRASTTCFALGEGMTVYFFVFRDSLKHRGIVESPQVSLVVDDGFMVPMR